MPPGFGLFPTRTHTLQLIDGQIAELEPSTTADLSMEIFDHVNNVNQRGVFMCMREELRVMRAQDHIGRVPGRPAVRGAITNVSSVAGLMSLPGYTTYVTSKHAVVGMTRNAGQSSFFPLHIHVTELKAHLVAATHAGDGIRVNAICPGFVDTALLSVDRAAIEAIALHLVPQKVMLDAPTVDLILILQ